MRINVVRNRRNDPISVNYTLCTLGFLGVRGLGFFFWMGREGGWAFLGGRWGFQGFTDLSQTPLKSLELQY